MQYRTGTVNVTPGSASVTGLKTKWLYVNRVLSQIDAIHRVFKIEGETTSYTISSITNDTTLTLSSNYAGSEVLQDTNYMICLDYSAFGYLPLTTIGDKDWATILKIALNKLDTNLSGPVISGVNTPRTKSIKFEELESSPPNTNGTLYYDNSESSKGFYYFDSGAYTWRRFQSQLLVEYF